MEIKKESSISEDIKSVMSSLIGKEVGDAMVNSAMKFDDPYSHTNEFFETCRKLFSELLGDELVAKKLQPIKDKYLTHA